MVADKNMVNIPSHVWEDEKFPILAIAMNPESYNYVSEEKRKDRKFFIDCFEVGITTLMSKEYIDIFGNCGIEYYKMFEYVDPRFKKDKELILEILGYDEGIYNVIDETLQKDIDVLEEYVSSMQYFTNDSKLPAYDKIHPDVLNDIEKMTKLAEIDPMVFISASPLLRGQFDFVSKAYERGKKIYGFELDEVASKIDEALLKDKKSAKKLLGLDAVLYYDIIPFYDGKEKEELILYAMKNAVRQKYTNLVADLKKDWMQVRTKNKVLDSKIIFIDAKEKAKKNIDKINVDKRNKPSKK